jgi:predicted nucleotide-binding protein
MQRAAASSKTAAASSAAPKTLIKKKANIVSGQKYIAQVEEQHFI